MSAPPPSAAQPRISHPDLQSPYFQQVISIIIHGKEITRLLGSLKGWETAILQKEDEVRRVQDRVQKELRGGEDLKSGSLAEAQRGESSYLRESRRHADELSGIEAVLDAVKRLAEYYNIDIEKAMLNAPQEEMIGAELGKYLSLRRRRAICYGVLTLVFTDQRNTLNVVISSERSLVDGHRRVKESAESYLRALRDYNDRAIKIILDGQRILGDLRAVYRADRLALNLEQERLSYAVVDLVLEWKRNMSED
ncbi:hypothetical protein JCM5353_006963 [Sporobolomyces roseus]